MRLASYHCSTPLIINISKFQLRVNPFPRYYAMSVIKNIGLIFLAIYLILVAVALIFGIITPSVLLGLIALVAAVFILIGK